MKKKLVFIVFFLVFGCLALEIGWASGKSDNLSLKKFEEAKQKLSLIISEARTAKLGNEPIVKEAINNLGSWGNINKNKQIDYDSIIKSINNFMNEIKTLITISRLEKKIINLENQNKEQVRFDSSDNGLSDMLIFIAICVIGIFIFSMLVGWYIGKQSTLRSLEKAGLW